MHAFVFISIIVTYLAALKFWLRYEEKRLVAEDWKSLKRKLAEHLENDDLSLGEWYDLIPVCRFADERYRKFRGPLLGRSCEETIRHFIKLRNNGVDTPA